MKKGIVIVTLIVLALSVFAEGKQDENRNYYGYGMMGSNSIGYGGGMMGAYSDFQNNGERIEMETAESLVDEYINSINEYDLSISEIMEFHQNFYVQIADNNSDFLVQELLVDPYSGTIYPEHGPNMMWNLSTSHMMGGFSDKSPKDMTVSETEAIAFAADYLDSDLPGTTPEDHADKFNGYYTIHVEKDHNIIGMLNKTACRR